MKMNKKQYLKSDIDSLYVPRTDGGRRLIVCKLCVKVEENQKQHSTQWKPKPKEFKKQDGEERRDNWNMKLMHGKSLKGKINTCKELKKSDVKLCKISYRQAAGLSL